MLASSSRSLALLVSALAIGAQAHAATAAPAPAGLVLVCPPNLTAACLDEVPPPALSNEEFLAQGGSFTSDCPDSVRVEWQLDTDPEGSCPTTFTRFYAANDGCGGFGTCSQVITLWDTVAPKVCVFPLGLAPCGIETKLCAVATDNCSELTWSAAITGGFNTYAASLVNLGDGTALIKFSSFATVVVTFTATDSCGNSDTGKVIVLGWGGKAAEGCGCNYWKDHTKLWDSSKDSIADDADFTINTSFNDFFGLTSAQSGFSNGTTMLQALKASGVGGNKLARNGITALLDIAGGVNLPLPSDLDSAKEIETAMNKAYKAKSFDSLAGKLGEAVDTQPEDCP